MRKLIRINLILLMVCLLLTAVSAEEADVCPCCGQSMDSIEWKELPANASLPVGHYRVTKDGTMLRAYTTSGQTTIDLNGFSLVTRENERAFFAYSGTLTVLDSGNTGSISPTGAIDDNGGIFRVRSGATLNIYGGTFNGAQLPAERKGGCIRVEGTVNMYGGTITGGRTQHHGGNVNISSGKFNLYGGTVSGGETFSAGRGGNFYLTGATAQLNIYGGTVSGGRSAGAGGNVFAYSGASVAIYGGTMLDGYGYDGGYDVYIAGSQSGKSTSLAVYGGTIGNKTNNFKRNTESNPLLIYNGSFSADPREFVADCACVYEQDGRYIVWNYGHQDQLCDGECPMEVAAEKTEQLYTGEHYYVGDSMPHTGRCQRCDYVHTDLEAVAVAEGRIYTQLPQSTGRVDLLADATVEDYLVAGTLNLNGYTLTADAVVAAAGKIIDTTQGQGLLIAPSLSLAATNPHIPVRDGEGLRFSSLTPDSTLERLDDDTVRVRFVFEEKAGQTVIDELVLAGNTDISVEFYLTWKNSQGVKKVKTYVCDPALLYKYAQKWDGRRFVATITGVDDVENLTCTVRVSANGVTCSDATLKNMKKIQNVLSWDAINSYPLKTKDMTVAEMRQLCVDFFEYSKTFLWTPDETVEYLRNKNDSNDSMEQGTIYGGLPYVGSASGSPYRMMDYIDPTTGLVDMRKAIPALANGGTLDMAELLYFGSQCAKTASLGWCRVINSANLNATMYFVPSEGVIILGDIEMDETISYWKTSYSTSTVCKANGEQVMYEAYAQLQKADGMVQYTTAGHVIMAYSDAVVVRNADGTINGKESYVNIIHQAQKWTDQVNEYGDQYQMKSSVNTKMTFASLYSGVYIPFTFKEFHGQAEIANTILNITGADGNILVRGEISEEDRSVVHTDLPENLTFSQLCGATIKSNYGISDVYIVIYNERGQELYRRAVRNSAVSRMTLALKENEGNVTVWQYAELELGKTYQAEIIVQCATGERPVIYSGDLTMDQ